VRGYEAAYRQSIEDPAAFWGEAARGIDWDTEPVSVLGDDGRWFAGGRLNPVTTPSTGMWPRAGARGTR